MVEDISNTSYQTLPVIRDYRQVKQFVQNTEQQVESFDEKLSFSALEALPPARRISSLPEKFKNNEYLSAAGLAALALVNLPEDWRDIKAAGNQINCALSGKKFKGSYNYKTFQHPFSFFRGTLLEPLVNFKKTNNIERARKLYDMDKTLLDTKFGKKINDVLGTELSEIKAVKTYNKKTKTWEIAKDINGQKRYAYAFKGSKFGKIYLKKGVLLHHQCIMINIIKYITHNTFF